MSTNLNLPITVKILINPDLQTVWDYFTKPEYITKWNFASVDWECSKASNDLRVGGKFSSTMAARDGSASFDFEGIYDEVEPLKSIRYHSEDERKVHTSFEELENGVKVTEVFDPETDNFIEMQIGDWQVILNNFKKCVENE